MKKIRKLLNLSIVGITFLVASSMAVAGLSTATYTLDLSNTYGAGAYGTVKLDGDTTAGTVVFTVDAAWLSSYGSPSNFGIQTFGFNTDLSLTTSMLSFPANWSWSRNKSQDGFGKFEWVFEGTGANRQDPLMITVSLGSNNPNAVVSNFVGWSQGGTSALFAAHVAGYTASPGSHFVAATSVIPAPAAASLVFIGLGLAGWMRRRLT